MAEGVLGFVLGTLMDPAGGFFSSQDADISQEDDGDYYTIGYGGGIFNSGTLTVSNSTLSDNSASTTGRILSHSPSPDTPTPEPFPSTHQ